MKVSPGCANCYAERDATRYGFDIWGPTATRRFFGDKHWLASVVWNKEAMEAGERRRVFCASMADVFEHNPHIHLDDERAHLFGLIETTPWLDWLLLTKRPENAASMFPDRWEWPHFPKNVWFGISGEDQKWLEERLPALSRVIARFMPPVVFASLEPLLGPIDLTAAGIRRYLFDWFIVGGESGPHARPMQWEWARSIREWCVKHRTPFFFKQTGAVLARTWGYKSPTGSNPEEWPGEFRVQEFPIPPRIGLEYDAGPTRGTP